MFGAGWVFPAAPRGFSQRLPVMCRRPPAKVLTVSMQWFSQPPQRAVFAL